MFCYCLSLNRVNKSRGFCGTDDLQEWVTYLAVNRKAFSVFLYFQSFHVRPTEKKVPPRTNRSVVISLSPYSKKPLPGTTDTKTATQTPYRGADKSIARPGRKQATATEILSFIYSIYNHNWRNISTIYTYTTRLASNEIFSPSNKIYQEVGRAKDLSAPLQAYRTERGRSFRNLPKFILVWLPNYLTILRKGGGGVSK
jgi:hypothetical protein